MPRVRRSFSRSWKRWHSLSSLSNIDVLRNLFLIFIGVSVVLWFIAWRTGFYDENWVRDVLVEAHGMWFDILILGILATILSLAAEKRQTLQRYNEEIDDFLGWESDEASYRIAGNIRRINRLGDVPQALTSAYLRNAVLRGANLTGVYLNGADLSEANLSGANLCNTSLRYANLSEIGLCKANLNEADLHNANLYKANLLCADLRNAVLYGANLSKALLRNATLCRADLDEANLHNANLNKADLSNATLSEADLSEAYIVETNLSGANLSSANLSGANLAAANLSGANLRDADLSGANLRTAQGLSEAQLTQAKLCMTGLPEGIDLDPNNNCSTE